jgi:hypothetical protein
MGLELGCDVGSKFGGRDQQLSTISSQPSTSTIMSAKSCPDEIFAPATLERLELGS